MQLPCLLIKFYLNLLQKYLKPVKSISPDLWQTSLCCVRRTTKTLKHQFSRMCWGPKARTWEPKPRSRPGCWPTSGPENQTRPDQTSPLLSPTNIWRQLQEEASIFSGYKSGAAKKSTKTFLPANSIISSAWRVSSEQVTLTPRLLFFKTMLWFVQICLPFMVCLLSSTWSKDSHPPVWSLQLDTSVSASHKRSKTETRLTLKANKGRKTVAGAILVLAGLREMFVFF